jgi:hypothetical protein
VIADDVHRRLDVRVVAHDQRGVEAVLKPVRDELHGEVDVRTLLLGLHDLDRAGTTA